MIELGDLFADPARTRSRIGRALVVDLASFATSSAPAGWSSRRSTRPARLRDTPFAGDGRPTELGVVDMMHLDLETLRDLAARACGRNRTVSNGSTSAAAASIAIGCHTGSRRSRDGATSSTV